MITILGLSGSLRRHSFNRGLLRAAAEAMPEGARLELGSIADIPLYDGDVEAQGIPAAVAALKERAAAAEALLLVTPEYNNGIPGVFKNAIDWMSRPADDIPRIFGAKPVGVIGTSPGRFGTLLSQTAWLPVLRTLGANHWSGGRLVVTGAGGLFDQAGNLTDAATRARLRTYLADFVEHIAGA
ncbi:NADPH-dependent FMN reductase [Sphingomonas crusticola]|uniref:NADPH-dependent FMN reductase n=1 Tax=Sphingomonas crusticola TaxID=1697973 RepID=UPI000E22D1E3|nr:NADPH-dependent FMN reductase [Sphingomonas crusticola]